MVLAAELVLRSSCDHGLETTHVLAIRADLAVLVLVVLLVLVLDVTLNVVPRLLTPIRVDKQIFVCFFDLTEI